MHDGSIAALEEAIEHYTRGVDGAFARAFAGSGRNNPDRSPAVHGFDLTASEKADLRTSLRRPR
jgi:cytochrome c peroxidase